MHRGQGRVFLTGPTTAWNKPRTSLSEATRIGPSCGERLNQGVHDCLHTCVRIRRRGGAPAGRHRRSSTGRRGACGRSSARRGTGSTRSTRRSSSAATAAATTTTFDRERPLVIRIPGDLDYFGKSGAGPRVAARRVHSEQDAHEIRATAHIGVGPDTGLFEEINEGLRRGI